MGKSNRKEQRVVNNIENLNMEIDYKRLADAIVQAQGTTNAERSIVSNTFAFLTAGVFRLFAFVGVVLGITLLIGTAIYSYKELVWSGLLQIASNVLLIVLVALVSILIISLSMLLIKSAKEIETEKDKQFVVAVFSAVASFAAVIIALVALVKG